MSHLEDRKSYGQILKSTTLIGGSQVINIILGIFRTKILAVFLGPIGIGLMGVYNSLSLMISTIAGLGIGSSGVRQVAESSSTGDQSRISRTIKTVRRLSLFLGLLGASLMAILSAPLSRVSFGTINHQLAISVLAITVLLGVVAAGQVALLQGLRHVADIASINVIGALAGTLFSIPVIYIWRTSGIVPFLIIVSLMNLIASWWYARKVPLTHIKLTLSDTMLEIKGLISLGLAFMASGVLTSGVIFVIRVVLTREFGLEAVGLYQAAYTLSGLYIGIILSAMGMDYYPRLTTVSGNREATNQLVRQQTEIGILMATPAIVATLLFGSFVLNIFYSTEFTPAYGILRWQILGVFLRVISWPLGYVILAKGRAKAYFLTELTANLVHLLLIIVSIKLFGLDGTGVAFFGLYVFYTAMIFAVVRRLSGFSWSRENLFLMAGASLFIGISVVLSILSSHPVTLIIAIMLTVVLSAYCLRRIFVLVGNEWFKDFRQQLLIRLRLDKRKKE